jgi:hypothetical protein
VFRTRRLDHTRCSGGLPHPAEQAAEPARSGRGAAEHGPPARRPRRRPATFSHGMAAVFRTICAQSNPEAVTATWHGVRDQPTKPVPNISFHKIALDGRRQDRGARFHRVPRPRRPKVWSNNPLEPVNKADQAPSRRGPASSPTPPPSGSSARPWPTCTTSLDFSRGVEMAGVTAVSVVWLGAGRSGFRLSRRWRGSVFLGRGRVAGWSGECGAESVEAGGDVDRPAPGLVDAEP